MGNRRSVRTLPRWLWMTPTKGCSSGAAPRSALVVLDTTSGRIATSLPTVGVTDDIFYDSGRHLVYVIGGEGAVEVLRQHDLDHYQPVRRITPAPGARTGLFVPGFNRRYERVGEPRPALSWGLRGENYRIGKAYASGLTPVVMDRTLRIMGDKSPKATRTSTRCRKR
jgi:hypothetical protein